MLFEKPHKKFLLVLLISSLLFCRTINCKEVQSVDDDYKWSKDGSLEQKQQEFPAITQLNDKIFRDFMNYNDYVFIMFYAEWCPHSRQFMPFFQKLKKEWDTKYEAGEIPYDVKFVKLKGDQYPDISESFDIENFPTFRFLIKGSIKQYKAAINAETMMRWLLAVLNKRPTLIETESQMADLIKSKDHVKLFTGNEVSSNWDNIVHQNYVQFQHEGLYYTTNKTILMNYTLTKFNAFWIVQKDVTKVGKETISYLWENEFELGEMRKWIKLSTTPFYQRYKDESTIKEIFGFNIPVMAQFSNGSTKYFDRLKEPLAEEWRERMVMVGFQGRNLDDPEDPETSLWNITVNTVEDTKNVVPAIWILMPSADGLMKFRFKGDMTSAEQVSIFIKEFYANKLTPNYKNQQFAEPKDGALLNMNSDMWDYKMGQLKAKEIKPFFVMVYAASKWDMCEQGYKMFKDLAEKFAKHEMPTDFFVLDPDMNDIPHQNSLEHIPQVFYFKTTERDGANIYGQRDFTEEGLYSFVKDLDGLDSLWLDFDDPYSYGSEKKDGSGAKGGNKSEGDKKKTDEQNYKFKVKMENGGIVGEHIVDDKEDPNYDQEKMDAFEAGKKTGENPKMDDYEQEPYNAKEFEKDL